MNFLQIWEKGISEVQLSLASCTAKPLTSQHRFRSHTHAFVEWGLVLSGRCDWWVDGKRYELSENDLILVPAEMLHQEEIPESGKARLAWIGMHFEGSAVELLQSPFILPAGRWATEVRRLFLTLYEEQSVTALGREQRIQLGLRELLLLIARAQQDAMQKSEVRERKARSKTEKEATNSNALAGRYPSRQNQLAHAAARYFENHIGQAIRIQEVAHYFQLSPQHFSVLFQKVHGLSPVRFVQEARHRQACRMLRHTVASIKEIAAECGYTDSAHFCRQFNMREGCSPLRYRKML